MRYPVQKLARNLQHLLAKLFLFLNNFTTETITKSISWAFGMRRDLFLWKPEFCWNKTQILPFWLQDPYNWYVVVYNNQQCLVFQIQTLTTSCRILILSSVLNKLFVFSSIQSLFFQFSQWPCWMDTKIQISLHYQILNEFRTRNISLCLRLYLLTISVC